MRYTLASGVEHPYSNRFTDNFRFVLPLVAILLLALYFGLTHSHKNQHHASPLTLGIYTIKSPSGGISTNSTSSDSGGGAGPSSPSLPIQAEGITASSSGFNGDLQGIVGGMGSGSVPPSSTGTQPSGGGSVPGGPSVVCQNLTSLSQLCTVCTPPLTVAVGQKVLLDSNGTCTLVN